MPLPPVRRSLCLVACVVALSTAPAGAPVAAQSAGADHFPTNEDLRHTRALGSPALSPDGRFVLVSVTEPTVDGASSHLWLVDVEKNTSRQLTFAPPKSKGSESQGQWSPDGRFVYFTAHRGDHTQLFRLPMDGGEPAPFEIRIVPPVDDSTAADAVDGTRSKGPLQPVDVDVSRFALSPDGRLAALIVRDPVTPGERKQRDDKADAELVDHETHGSRAYLFDPATSRVTPVAVPPNVSNVVWAHGSDRLIVTASTWNGADDLGPARSAWLVPVAHPEAAQRLPLPATVGGVVWSPGDGRLFFDAQADIDAPPGYSDLFTMPLAGGPAENLTKTFPGTLDGAELAESENVVIASVTSGTARGLARVDAASGAIAPIALGRGAVSSLDTNARRTGWVYLRSSADEPTALYYTVALDRPGRALDVPATAGAWRAVKARVVRWQSDAFTIEGLLYLPPEAASTKVPLIVDVHGGPTGVWVDSYSTFIQFLVGHGWAVLEPNPRGSTGYGAAFAAANKNDLGGGDYRDIMAGVDYAIAHEPVDPARLGLYGYSYGGEMAGFVEGKTDRFKAIISAAPVIDQFSEYGTEGGSWYDRWFFGKPWEHFEDAWRQSPLAGAGNAKTPFLLLQGEADTTDPAGQSQEMYRALRQSGVPVQLVLYPRENHGPLARGISGAPSSEPWHGFDGRQRIVRFFEAAFGG
jgi:dipeptidyl aminopeptidase/acylaminoacyl peptidase